MKLHEKLNRGADKVELQIAPLIDVVFLLLIYFMVTAALVKREADISFVLPATSKAVIKDIPLEIMVVISPEGQVEAEGLSFSPQDSELMDLAYHMRSMQAVANSQGSTLSVTIVPDADTIQERIIDVMDACAHAGVKSVSFGAM